jgi:cytoskeletal protein RodZ
MRYNYKRSIHRRYLMTLSVCVPMAAIIIGSLGGVVDAASRYNRFTQPTVQRSAHSTTSPSSRTTTMATSTTPPTTTPTAPTPPTPAINTTTQAPVVTSQPVAPARPPDTAAAAQTTTAAQSHVASIVKPVTYTSHQISDELRNRLMLFAGALAFTGLGIYSLTLIRRPQIRHIPVRHVIPVEVIA